MIKRELDDHLKKVALQVPVIAILGPRQSGKTTLARATFDQHKYISLEDLDMRAQAMQDPREFLAFHRNPYGLILDEIQNAPTILSYIQTYVDQENVNGYFILTGSQNFLVNQAISQTLAGRMIVFTLLPLSLSELATADLLPDSPEELILKGSYPRLYAQEITTSLWYASYTLTYIERDVRQVTSIGDLTIFKLFLQLCAGRIGQLLNLSSLANDCGISLRTAQQWISLLQASYIILLLQPHYKNFSKRLVKTPKIYFYDTGLANSLLGIESVEQLQTHYLRGGLFENLIISDLFKQYYNAAKDPRIYFWRDNHGHEIDCIIEKTTQLIPIEIKSGRTVNSDYFSGIKFWQEIAQENAADGTVVYAGEQDQRWGKITVMSWKHAGALVNHQ